MTQTATIVNIRDRSPTADVPKTSRSCTPRRDRQVVDGRYRIGSLYKQPSGLWATRVTDLETGKVFKKSSGCSRKSDALEALCAILSRPEKPADVWDVDRLLSAWLDTKRGSLRSSTLKGYGDVNSVLSKSLGSVEIHDLSFPMIEDFVLKQGGRMAGKALTQLRMALTWGVRRGLLESDPSAGLKAPRYTKREFRVPTLEEAERLLGECRETYLRKIVAIAFLTGLRRASILSLTVADLDVSTGLLSVDGSRMKGRRGIQIPVRPDLLAVLTENLPSDPAAPLVGRKVVCFKTAFALATERSDMEWLTFHSLRRAFGSWLAAAGTDYLVIQELMGHAVTDVTRRYIDPALLAKKKREAVDRLPAIL